LSSLLEINEVNQYSYQAMNMLLYNKLNVTTVFAKNSQSRLQGKHKKLKHLESMTYKDLSIM